MEKLMTLVFVVLCSGLFSCKRESLADYIPFENDTINNPLAPGARRTPFDLEVLYNKMWTGYSSKDSTIKYIMLFHKNKGLYIESHSSVSGTYKSENCSWDYVDPDIFMFYTTKMYNNSNIKGTWKITGDVDAVYLTRNGASIQLK